MKTVEEIKTRLEFVNEVVSDYENEIENGNDTEFNRRMLHEFTAVKNQLVWVLGEN